MIGLLLGLFLLAMPWAAHYSVGRRYQDGSTVTMEVTAFSYQSALCFFVALALLLAGLAAPSRWIAAGCAWIAFSVPITAFAWAWGKVEVVAHWGVQTGGQLSIVGAVAIYTGLAHLLRPALDLPVVAGALCAWFCLNACVLARQRKGIPLHSWIKHRRIVPANEHMGVCDNSSELAWLCAVTALSVGYGLLRGLWAAAALLPFIGWALWTTKNRSATVGLFGGILAGLSAFTLLPLLAIPPALAAVAGTAWRLARTGENSVRLRRKHWGEAWEAARRCSFLGFGPGLWTNHTIGQTAEGGPQHAYTTLHNDWLQAVVEVGAVPVLCFAGYLVTAWATLPATPEAAYAFSLVAFTAVYAFSYYPRSVPAQLTALLIGMGALAAR